MLRQKVYSMKKSLSFNVYYPYIAINQTDMILEIIPQQDTNFTLEPYSSKFFLPEKKNIWVRLNNYISQPFNISTIGISGSIILNKSTQLQRYQVNDPKQSEPFNIEIGTSISLCQAPYQRTYTLKFVPRYIISNNLSIPLIIKESRSYQQTSIIQNQKINFNFDGNNDLMMVRLIDFEQETNFSQIKQNESMTLKSGNPLQALGSIVLSPIN
mmetsp:Transcript_33530/g.32603  ORF Transcript_33530/g.32603 Transcript_33530/m.32603 type:complete len:213 (+) Transcript_33530:89-727(+)